MNQGLFRLSRSRWPSRSSSAFRLTFDGKTTLEVHVRPYIYQHEARNSSISSTKLDKGPPKRSDHPRIVPESCSYMLSSSPSQDSQGVQQSWCRLGYHSARTAKRKRSFSNWAGAQAASFTPSSLPGDLSRIPTMGCNPAGQPGTSSDFLMLFISYIKWYYL